MNQCLRCKEPCSAATVFCDQCRSLLRDQLHQNGEMLSSDVSKQNTAPLDAISSTLEKQEKFEQGFFASDPETPPFQIEPIMASQEQAVFLLSDAARRIAEVEPSERRLPRASRLSPLRDISSQIQRHSTPLSRLTGGASTEPMLEVKSEEEAEVEEKLPDLWPWLPESEESEPDHWKNEPDPLGARKIPTFADVAPLEKADLRRARKEGFTVSSIVRPQRTSSRMRLAFFCLALMAVLALTVDSVLISFNFIHTPQANRSAPPGAPSLTLTPSVTNYGGHVTLHLRNFAHGAEIALTHDVAVPLNTAKSNERFTVDAVGSANIETVIDESWEPGFHTIVAEDTVTRYTANASLQVAEGPTPPAKLVLSTSEIDFGAAVVGGTTIQRFVLNNGGGGSITWSANSDAPWLSITPNQGVFSDAQTITIGCTRSNLKPGDYTGTITFSSSVGGQQKIQATMTVRPLPVDAGPVLGVAPAGLSFTSVDGGADPSAQSLVISNPGSQPLNWTMSANSAMVGNGQNGLLGAVSQPFESPVRMLGPATLLLDEESLSSDLAPTGFLGLSDASTNWVTTDKVSGTILPRDFSTVNVMVHSGSLLPGTYINTLVFSADKNALNTPQSISISLNVQPKCGLTLSTGSLSFTAIVGQSNPSGQSFNLMPTASCVDTVSWDAVSSASWLAVTPLTGQMSANNSATPPSVSVNTNNLSAGQYSATISVMAGQSTQTVIVTLNLQAPPPPTAPIMGVSTLSLNLTTTQGATSPSGQLVTIANTGQSPLQWRTTVNLLANSWLGVYPSGGVIAPTQTGALTVNAITKNLTPGKYVGQIILIGTDSSGNVAGGSPQTVAVSLTVLPPCKITQPSSSSLAFSGVQGGSDPGSQSMVLTASGNCLWPLSLHTTVSGSASWLNVTASSSSFAASGQPTTLVVAASVNGLAAGNYTGQVSLGVTDSSGVQVGTAQSFSVALTVVQPCALQVSTNPLTFSLIVGGTSKKSVSFTETGSCSWPIGWSASSDNGSNSWLSLTGATGSDSGAGGNFGVNIATASMTPGTYKGMITITASGSGQANVLGSPAVIPVTLTVSSQPTVSVSGIVNACVDAACSSSAPLPGATVTLKDSNGNSIGQVTTDSAGSYTISGVPPSASSYTITASGTDVNSNKYASSPMTLTVSSAVTGFTINATPAS
jgi:Viral BACON domain/Carboxypeptidase regulatory-like domain/Bacterial Ig domain